MTPIWEKALLAAMLCFFGAPMFGQNLAGDEALSKVLVEGEDWQVVAEGFGFTDGACADAEGNFYFMDLRQGTAIQKIAPEGKTTPFIENAPKCSGLKFGPDGRLYACTQGPKKQVVAIEVPSGKVSVLADNVQPNDLIVSHKGYVYFTETGKGQVTIVDTKGNVRVGATGSLDAGSRYMELRTPVGKADSGGDGSTTDSMGRYYVASHLGIQMFDSTGRMGGVIAKPSNKGCVSIAFGGPNLEYLYACASDKIYRRKMKTKGVSFFRSPATRPKVCSLGTGEWMSREEGEAPVLDLSGIL